MSLNRAHSMSIGARGPRGVTRGLGVVALLACATAASAQAPDPEGAARPESDKISAKVERYAEALVRRYDRNDDGALTSDEWSAMQGQPGRIDRDRDGRLVAAEVIEHVQRYSRQRSWRLLPAPHKTPDASGEAAASPIVPTPVWRRFFVPRSEGSPTVQAWFDDNDVDGDGQVTMSEFSPTITEIEAARFAEIDANGDGVIVPTEYQAWLPPEVPVEEAEAAAAQRPGA